MESNYDQYDKMEVEELILHFRNLYKEIYVTPFEDGSEYIWRTLTQKEYQEITEFAKNQDDAFERICNTAVLYPTHHFHSTGPAYLPESLAPQILNESGYGEIRKEQFLLNSFRRQIEDNFEKQAEIMINYAFPYITFEEMEEWTKEKLLKYLARAEWNLKVIQKKTHLQLMTEEEAKQMAEEAEETIEEAKEKTEEFNLMELANELRRQGQDPMFVLRHLYKKEKESYFVRPLIGGLDQTDTMIAGIDAWKEGELPKNGRYDVVSEQVQRVSPR